jgi:hypothetical protein
MKSRIKITDKSFPQIKDTSKKAEQIKVSTIKASLGAEEVLELENHEKGSPLQFFALRQELYQRLRSIGGRKSLEGVDRRQKIPLSDEDWEKLQKLAEQHQNKKVRPSPAQVASVLLHQALQELEQKAIISKQ